MTAIKNGTLLVKDSNGNTARVATLSQTDITTLNTALTDIEANKRKISSISANYVTTNTEQDITGFKHFKTDLETSTSAIDVNNPTDVSMDGSRLIFADKNNIVLGTVYSGVYAENKTIDVNWTRLAAYSKDKNKLQRIEVQVTKEGKGILYAPSLVTGEEMKAVATDDWVYHRSFVVNGVNYVIGNNLQIATHQFKTVNGGFATVTFPAPFVVPPYIYLTQFVSNGDFRLFSTQITNLTTTSVQIACATEGRLIECFYHILAVGYTS